MRTIIFSAIMVFAAAGAKGEPLFADLKSVKDLRVSLGADNAKPSVRIRCREIGVERARIGFLRVGLLRFPVIRDMELQLGDQATSWASDFLAYAEQEAWLGNASVRGLQIVCSKGKTLLRAETANLNIPAAKLELREVSFKNEGRPVVEKFASVALRGADQGTLILPETRMKVIDLPYAMAAYDSD
jgi:hypothetical protein